MVHMLKFSLTQQPIEHGHETARVLFVKMPLKEPIEETQNGVRVVVDLEDFGDVAGFEFRR